MFVFLQDVGANAILQDIARARENIQKSLAGVSFCARAPFVSSQGENLYSLFRRLTLTPDDLCCFSNNINCFVHYSRHMQRFINLH